MQSIIVIADDLTGAADTGVQFSPYFDRTVLLSYLQLPGYLQKTSRSMPGATALYTNSRALTADMANRRLVSVADRIPASAVTWLYKKIDSCLRGNLASEIEALMDALAYDLSFIAPAFPKMGRTTEDDIHQVYGIPLARTEIGRDPVTPVPESRLSRVVETQSRYPVGHVKSSVLEGAESGLQAELQRLAQRGVRHIVFDAATRSHLDRIARFCLSFPYRILPVGSAGLAGSISGLLPVDPKAERPPRKRTYRGMNLLVCGSISEVTWRQINALSAKYAYTEIALDLKMLADPKQQELVNHAVPGVRSTLSSNNVIIRIDPSKKIDEVARGGANRVSTVRTIVENLGRFAASVATATRPGLLFITGGDTADAVFTAAKAGGMEIHGEILPGVVKGTLFDGPLDGLPVVTKAGAFGQETSLVELHEAWQKIAGA